MKPEESLSSNMSVFIFHISGFRFQVFKSAYERSLCELDLESVLSPVLRAFKRDFRGVTEIRGGRGLAGQRGFCFVRAPGLGADAAECDARAANRVSVEIEADRGG